MEGGKTMYTDYKSPHKWPNTSSKFRIRPVTECRWMQGINGQKWACCMYLRILTCCRQWSRVWLATVHVNKNDVCLLKPFPLLFCFAITNAALEDKTQLWKICKWSCTAFQKLMCVRTQHFSEEAFHLFGSALPILGRTLPICDAAAPQMHVWKSHQMHISSFMHIVIA